MLEVLLEADRRIAASKFDDPHAFYSLLHETAEQIAPVDAFYVALHSPVDEILVFPYNVDDGVYDEPCALPLGSGPTSWVIRNNAAVRWDTVEEQDAVGMIPFGNTTRLSQSAVHLPMRECDGGAPLGVLSAQSYRRCAYDAQAVRLLQWLADRAARALRRHREERAYASLRGLHSRFQSLMVDRFSRVLQDVEHEVVDLMPLVRPGNAALLSALARLRHACQGHQTRIGQLALDAMAGGDADESVFPLHSDAELSMREAAILRLLGSGASNAEIAEALYISVNTVKFHCKSIFGKLHVRNRTEAARFAPKPTPSSR